MKEFKTECGSSKQVGMCPGIEHQKGKLSVVLFPNEKPIRLDMAFPRVVAFEAGKLMGVVFLRQ
jgi:hypothetical protein